MRVACGIFCLLCAFTTHAGADTDPPLPGLEFLYITANIAASSGGHSALKFGEVVYHFQYTPDGLFLLARDPWPQFRYIYNDLENRSMFCAQVQVPAADYESIKGRFIRYYLVQEKHLAYLKALRSNVQLLESFESPQKALPLPGAGLFAEGLAVDPDTLALRNLVAKQYGPDFLYTTLQQCLRELQSLPLAVPDITGTEPAKEKYPSVEALYCERYLDLCSRIESLKTLLEARPLAADAVLDPQRFTAPGSLSAREQALLKQYALQLQSAVLQLLTSARPDRGYPLLLATARYLAVQHSLAANRLLVLDPFSDHAVSIEKPDDRAFQQNLSGLASRELQDYQNTRRTVFEQAALSERNYNLLETAAGRYYEISSALIANTPVRIEAGWCIPSKARPITTAPPAVRPVELHRMLGRAQENLAFYREKIAALYNYGLIRKNCSTELSRTLNAAFPDPQAARSALGDYLEPGANLSYIPFRFQQAVEKRFSVQDTTTLPSYRLRMLQNLYAQQNRAATYFRECTTLTSSVYSPHAEDTAFLLFTDDVFWPRPLYGIINTAYGVLQAGAGIVCLPFDRGQRTTAGLRGVLYSIPELFLCNIRKGSFSFLPAPAVQADLTSPALNRHVAP